MLPIHVTHPFSSPIQLTPVVTHPFSSPQQGQPATNGARVPRDAAPVDAVGPVTRAVPPSVARRPRRRHALPRHGDGRGHSGGVNPWITGENGHWGHGYMIFMVKYELFIVHCYLRFRNSWMVCEG